VKTKAYNDKKIQGNANKFAIRNRFFKTEIDVCSRATLDPAVNLDELDEYTRNYVCFINDLFI